MSLLAELLRLSTLAFGEKLQMPRKYFLISFTLSLQPSRQETWYNQSPCEARLSSLSLHSRSPPSKAIPLICGGKETSSERGENPHYIGWHGGSPSNFSKILFIALKPHVNGGPRRMRGFKDWIMKSKQAFFLLLGCYSMHPTLTHYSCGVRWRFTIHLYASNTAINAVACCFVLPAQAQCTAHPSCYQILLMLLLVTDITTQLCVMWAYFTSFFDANAHYVFNSPCRTGQQAE